VLTYYETIHTRTRLVQDNQMSLCSILDAIQNYLSQNTVLSKSNSIFFNSPQLSNSFINLIIDFFLLISHEICLDFFSTSHRSSYFFSTATQQTHRLGPMSADSQDHFFYQPAIVIFSFISFFLYNNF
jgi:hypothetical protein